MNKVYVVTSGIYSDYSIEKVFSNREDAEKYCALENSNSIFYSCDEMCELDRELYWEYECRIEEYTVDDAKIDLQVEQIKKRYIYSRYKDEEYFTSYGTIYTNRSFVKVTEYTKERVGVAVIVDYDMPIESVKKIVYDEIAKYGAAANNLI